MTFNFGVPNIHVFNYTYIILPNFEMVPFDCFLTLECRIVKNIIYTSHSTVSWGCCPLDCITMKSFSLIYNALFRFTSVFFFFKSSKNLSKWVSLQYCTYLQNFIEICIRLSKKSKIKRKTDCKFDLTDDRKSLKISKIMKNLFSNDFYFQNFDVK